MNEIGKHEPECNDRCTGDSHFLSGTASCDVCDTGFAMEQHDCPKRTLPQDGEPSAFSDLSNAMPIPKEWHKAQAPCECCGGPVPVLEAHGVGLYGLHFGLLHPKCADFANKIANHLSPPKASAE